jgi:hypothetical protein
LLDHDGLHGIQMIGVADTSQQFQTRVVEIVQVSSINIILFQHVLRYSRFLWVIVLESSQMFNEASLNLSPALSNIFKAASLSFTGNLVDARFFKFRNF